MKDEKYIKFLERFVEFIEESRCEIGDDNKYYLLINGERYLGLCVVLRILNGELADIFDGIEVEVIKYFKETKYVYKPAYKLLHQIEEDLKSKPTYFLFPNDEKSKENRLNYVKNILENERSRFN